MDDKMMDGLTEQEVVQMQAMFSLSQPIKIPTKMLSTEYEYRWINIDKKNVYQRRRGVGWMPIKDDELERLVVEPYTVEDLHMGTHVNPDGFIAIGDDLILARITRRHAEAIRAHFARLNREKLKSSKRRFHEAGKMAGVYTYEDA